MRLRRDRRRRAVAIARQMVPPNSIRSAPSSRSISTASAWVAPVRRRAACATASAVSRVSSPAGGSPSRPTAGEDLAEVARHDAAAEDLLRARQVGEAGGDLPAREGLDDRQRALSRRQRRQDDALERLVVLGQDEVAEALAHLAPRPARAWPGRRPCLGRAPSAWSRAADSARGSRASRCRRARAPPRR